MALKDFSFNEAAFGAFLSSPEVELGLQEFAKPDLLRIAKDYVNVKYTGPKNYAYNPGGMGKPPFRIDGLFHDTLELEIGPAGTLHFTSSAAKRGHAYGQALIDGTAPYAGAYTMLPPEFY